MDRCLRVATSVFSSCPLGCTPGGVPPLVFSCVVVLVSFFLLFGVVFFPLLRILLVVVDLFSVDRCSGWFVSGACSFVGGGSVSVVVVFEVHSAPQCSLIGELAAYW